MLNLALVNAFFDQLNSKEYAWAFYVLFGLGLCMLSRDMRRHFWGLTEILFSKSFLVIYLIALSYITLSVILLRSIGIWDFSLLKDSVFWTFLVAFPLMFKANKTDTFEKFIRTVVVPLFKFSVVFEFIFGLYTFSLWVEMIIIPVIVFVSVMLAVAEGQPAHKKVHTLFQWILNLLMLWIIYGIGKHLFRHYDQFCNMATLRQFLNPLLLSILFLPLLYGLSIYLHYQTVLVILKRYLKNSGNYRYAVNMAMWGFKGDIEGLLRWKNLMVVKHLQSKKEIREAIALIKTLRRTERNPHTVNPELGWSPYLAKDFLLARGIKTLHYSNTYEDEFCTISSPFKINKNIIEDTITYSVTGNQLVAWELHLELRVFDGNGSLEARRTFLGYAEQLYFSAIEQPIPSSFGKAILKSRPFLQQSDFATIALDRHDYGNKTNGYSLELRIVHQSQKLRK